MKTSLLTSALLLIASSLGAPTALGAPALTRGNETRSASSQNEIVFPSLQVRWKSMEPNKFAENTPVGHLLSNPNEQVHTAVYFSLSAEQAKGKTCKFVFRLSQNDWAVNQLSQTPPTFDIYRLNGCLNDKYSWGNKVSRGAHAGILTPVKGGAANWQGVDMSTDIMAPIMGAAPTFSCSPGEYSFEMIARAGANIGWTSGRGSGLSLELCS